MKTFELKELPLPCWEGSLVPVCIETSAEKSSYSKTRSASKRKVHFEDGSVILLYPSEIRQFQLKEKIEGGSLLEGDEYIEFMRALCKRARAKAMSLLKDRDRTEADIRSRLIQNGFPEQVIEDAISYLYHYHYLDDTRFITQYLFQNRGRKSTKQIVQELKNKGISDEQIEVALESENDGSQAEDGLEENKEEQAARMLYEKYCRRKPVHDLKDRQKVASYLMGKGFSWDTVRTIVFESLSDDFG